MNQYPVYPNYSGMPNPGMGPAMMPVNPNMVPMNQGMIPMNQMPMNQGIPMANPMNQPSVIPTNIDIINNNQDDDSLTSLKRQVNNLERRVNRLEETINGSTSFGNKYTDSNYHIL